MGNPRSFTTNYVNIKASLERVVKRGGGRSMKARKAAIERAAGGGTQ